jgi:hypothetical protein
MAWQGSPLRARIFQPERHACKASWETGARCWRRLFCVEHPKSARNLQLLANQVWLGRVYPGPRHSRTSNNPREISEPVHFRIFLVVLLAVVLWSAWQKGGLPSPASRTSTFRQPEAPEGAPSESEVFAALKGSPELELLSIEPGELGPGCVHKVLGSAKLSRTERRRAVDAILQGIQDSDGLEAACFEPRHGIVAGRYALSICYACCQVYAWELSPGKKVDFNSQDNPSRKWLTTSAPGEVLTSILKERGVPLPKH